MWVLAEAPASPVNFSIQDLINQMIQNDSEVYEVYFIRCSDTLHAKRLCTRSRRRNHVFYELGYYILYIHIGTYMYIFFCAHLCQLIISALHIFLQSPFKGIKALTLWELMMSNFFFIGNTAPEQTSGRHSW